MTANFYEKIKTKTQDILATLPIAHYLRVSTIKVNFDESTPTSYLDISTFEITISFRNIIDAINNSGKKENEIDDLFLEKTIRALLYHEVSHAILTPIHAKVRAEENHRKHNYIIDGTLLNIIEDERIETILKHYYHNVNFKENIRNICQFIKEPKNFKHFVFNAFRFRYSNYKPNEVKAIVETFLEDSKNINADNFRKYGQDESLVELGEKALRKLKALYDEYLAQKEQEQQEQQNNSDESSDSKEENSNEEQETEHTNEEDSQSEESEEDSQEDNDSQSEDDDKSEEGKDEDTEEDEEQENEEEQESSGFFGDEEDEDVEIDSEELEALQAKVEDVVRTLEHVSKHWQGKTVSLQEISADKEAKVELLKILGKSKGFGTQKAPAQYGYNGRFSPKKYATDFNDSCKWFKKKDYSNTGINTNKNAKKVLNIWLDNSGSFFWNDVAVNKILKSLYELEKMDNSFTFNLIKVSEGFTETSGDNRTSQSNGGNEFSKSDADKFYKKYNPTQKEQNIILFDGAIFSYVREYYALDSFNNNRSVFIIENSNATGIKTYCSKAKEIIIENSKYADRLKENIIKAVNYLF